MAYVVERNLVHGTRFMGMYLDPDGHKRSAGSFSTRREAQRAAHREEQKVLAGSWHDTSLGQITFGDYVESEWLPHKHLEASTRGSLCSPEASTIGAGGAPKRAGAGNDRHHDLNRPPHVRQQWCR